MEELDGFNSLDPLGPEYGKINQPLIDEKGFSAFEGDKIEMPKADLSEPSFYYPSIPGVGNLNRPNRPIVNNHVKTNAVNPSIPQKPINAAEYKASNMQKLDAFFQANQDKNNYAKIFSYNAGPDGNAFYKRYAAYGQEKFDEVGFSPLRDNEANFNARTTRWDDFSRMMTHSFIPLFTRGFVSGPKSLGKMLTGDFTSADLEDARVYEEAAAIGQSNKGGIFGFANNAMMNFGYTAGIITEAIAEEAAGALLAAPTGGSSLIATTANNLLKIPKLFKGLNAFKAGKRGYQAVKDTLRLTDKMVDARKFWQGAKETALGNFAAKAGQALNPLENTVDAVKRLRQADNLTDLAILSKTAGGFYRDVRKINMALSEARLEAGMVENNVFDKLYNEAYKANDNQVPNDKELAEIEKQAKDASYETLIENAALVYGSNAITFNNITSPKGGLRSFMKSTTDDIAEIAAREGQKNFGKIGKVIYDRAAKKFAIEKNNLKELAKGWLKNPIYKSAGKTIGYFKANFTEGIQENLQETIAEANEKYFIDSYKSPTLQSMLYSRATIRAINRGKLDYFSDSWEKQNPFTAQGAETFASGFFMGALAGPLNGAVPFLSSTYNRMFNKEQYEKWKTKQLKSAENLVKELNDMSLKEFMGDNIQNLGAQDLLATVKNTGSKKEGLDTENEIFVSQVRTLRSSGTFGLFKEQLEDLKEMTDKEFADVVKIDESEVPKYRKRIDSSVERLDRIKDLYDRVERKNPSPVQKDIDLNDPDNMDQAFLKAAWDKNNENMVFFNEVYDNALGRRAKIEEKYNSNPKYKSIDNRQRNLLFRPEDMADELDILNKELQAEKELGTNPNKVKQLEDKIKITKDYQENFRIFDAFFNRGDYAEVIGEEYKKEFGKEASPEELVEYMDQKLGSLDNENIKIGILQRLKDSHKNYLKTLAQQKGDYVFDADTDETFELLADYYKLGHEVKQITKYIEVLNDPDAFLDVLRRNMAWMKNQHAQRVKYFEGVVTSEMDKVRNNAFLNELANRGYYMSREDMDSYFSDGIAPEEIFNNITKEVYEKGSEKYKEIYQEFFQKREELKSQLNPRKTGIIDSAYQAEIDKLNAEKEDKINKLPKTETRVELGDVTKKGKNKTFSITELVDQLNPNEYVEVKVKGADQTLFPQIYFMDENGDLHFDNAEGDFVEISNVKDRYTEGKRFTLEMRPDPLEVEKIETEYKQLIDEVEERYAEAKSNIELEIPFEDVTPNSDLSTPDLQEFRKQLYQIYRDTFVESLPEEAQNELANDSELDNKTFEQWYAMPENKKYFDAYNKKNRPEVSNAEVVITYKGLDIDTKTKSLEQLIKYRDQINNDVTRYNETIKATPKDQVESIKKSKEELKELKKTLKAINNVVALRQFNKFPKSVQESVKGIQKVIDQQKGVFADSMVTEFDPVTGLKPGQRSYKINGDFYRRVTNAMQDVLSKKYTYKGEQLVINAFEQTIGKLGLNDKSIDSFLSLIKANLDSDPESLPGTNDILLFSNDKNPNNLEDTLKSLSGLSPEQIKIEREKQGVLDKIENLNKKIYDIEDSEEVNESKLNTYRDQREELYKKVIEIESRLRGTTAPVSDTEAKKADVEKRREEELTELGQKQLTKGFNSLSEATKPEQVANAIVNIEQNKNQGALLSKEQEQTLSEARAKLKEQGYEIVDYNIVKYGENTIVEGVDFYNSEKDVLTEEQANAIESKINSLEKRGEEVNVDDLPSPVSRTIKPLIKKDGKMVQAAKVNTLIFESVEQAKEAIIKSREAGNKKPNAADKINAKYDAELKALEQPTSTATDEAKKAEIEKRRKEVDNWQLPKKVDPKKQVIVQPRLVAEGNEQKIIDTLNNILDQSFTDSRYRNSINRLNGAQAVKDTSRMYDDERAIFLKTIKDRYYDLLNQELAALEGTVSDKKAEGTNARGTTYKGETTEKDGLKVTEYSEFRPDGKRISKGGRIMTPSEFIEEYNITDQDYLDSLEGATEIRIYQVRVGKDGKAGISIQGTFPEGNVEMEVAGVELAATEGGVSEEVTINDISTTQSNINDVQTLDGKYWVPKKVFEEAYKNDTGNRGQQTLDSIISRGGYSIKELDKLLPNWKELTVELNRGKATPTSTDLEDSATKNNTTKDIITQFFRENTYQDGRDAGNFFDLAKDYLETGLAPAFDEEIITREAYDELFNETSGYLTEIKRRVDAGEFYLVGRDIVVWKEIIRPDGTLDRIAGEIDIILANENGIFVVDIKSGEERKFLNFNSLSTSKELYSKRNDYTLQTGIYATMLEDQIDRRVAGIAMLPIQRTSNKNTNQVVSAGKPTARTMYYKVVYKYDDKGNPVLNKFGEKQFEQTKIPFEIDFLVPLDRNSVKNELEQLLPRSATQMQPGSKSAAEKKFRIFKNNLETITDENSPKNRKRLADLEKLVEDFSKENNVPIPQDLKDALDAKSTTFRAYRNKEVLDSIINKYNKISKNSASVLEEKTKELEETKSEMSFDDIDLSDQSPFVLAQLASDDDVFIEHFKKHEKFKLKTSKPTVGQINAIQAMITSGLVEPVEVDDILTMAEASEIIHDGVIRIQYLKVNSETNAEARKLSEYQRTIFSLLSLTKSVQSNKAVADVLSNALEDANNGNIAEAVKNVDLEILSTKNQIDSEFTTNYQKKNLNDRLEDLENFKDALASTYAFAPSEVGPEILDQKVEEDEGVSILFEIPTVKPKFSIGDTVYSKKRNNNKEYTIVNVTEKNVMIVDENNKKSTVKIDTFGNNYYTSQEMNTGKPDAGYELQDTEQNIINQSQKTVDDFIQDSAALDKAKAEADKEKQSDIEAALLKQIKICP